MTWETARNEALELWRQIRRMVDRPDELELLTEINAVCALCEIANSEEPKTLTRCERCLTFQQFGGCQGINLEMTEKVVAKDWDALRGLIDKFINLLQDLEIPDDFKAS